MLSDPSFCLFKVDGLLKRETLLCCRLYWLRGYFCTATSSYDDDEPSSNIMLITPTSL